MKVAFDENVPLAMVRVFQTFANERQLKKLIASVEVKSAKDYAPQRGDGDYRPKDDTPWIKRFAEDGGKVIISGDTAMRYVPHERLALVEAGLLVFFFDGKWSEWGFFHKCSLLIHHWQIPLSWSEKAKLRKTSLDDPRKLKFERRAKRKHTSRKKPQAVEPDMQKTQPPNFFHLLGRPDDTEEKAGP